MRIRSMRTRKKLHLIHPILPHVILQDSKWMEIEDLKFLGRSRIRDSHVNWLYIYNPTQFLKFLLIIQV